jgi:hypothetical protein
MQSTTAKPKPTLARISTALWPPWSAAGGAARSNPALHGGGPVRRAGVEGDARVRCMCVHDVDPPLEGREMIVALAPRRRSARAAPCSVATG